MKEAPTIEGAERTGATTEAAAGDASRRGVQLKQRLRQASYAEGVVMLKPSDDDAAGQSDGGAQAVVDADAEGGAAKAAEVLLSLSSDERGAVLEALSGSHLELLERALAELPEDETGVALMIDAIEAHYGVAEVTGEWTVAALRQVWSTLALVPPGDVDSTINTDFQELHGIQADHDSTGGAYYGDDVDKVEMEYDPDAIATDENDGYVRDDPLLPVHRGHVMPGDALEGTNRFDKVLLHEIGHAVDDQLGYMDTHMSEEACGEWEEYGNAYAIVGRVDDASGYPYRALSALLTTRDGALAAYQSVIDPAADADDPGYQEFLTSPAVQMLLSLHGGGKLFYSGPEVARPLAVDGYVYQWSYDSSFTRYALAARDHQVSNYQFRAPGEWFAELYAAFYLGTLPESHPFYERFKTEVHERGHTPETKA